jgi:type I restriction enzyme S subunit
MAKITPCMENGKAAIARRLLNGHGFGSTEFHVLRPSEAVLSEFVYHFVRQESFRSAAEMEMTGSVGQKRVPAEFMQNARVPLPPLAEQARIVARVDESSTHVEAARERLAKLPVILKRLRQAVLAAACSGRLTEDWRDGRESPDPTRELVDRLASERRRLWSQELVRHSRDPATAQYPVQEPPTVEFQFEVPDSWAIVSMDQLMHKITSGSRDWRQYYNDKGPGTFIMAQNVRPLRFDRTFRLGVDPPPRDRDRERSKVIRGDLLVTIVGANTGDVCRVTDDLDQHYVCQSVALMRPVIEETSAFLELWLNSPQHGQLQYKTWIYGEGRPHLSFDHLKSTAVALPSIAEQAEIVQRVVALFKVADAIDRRVTVAATRADKLTQAILARAFRGELVPTEAELARQEGRDYEPASAMLERIRAGNGKPTQGELFPTPRRGRRRRT